MSNILDTTDALQQTPGQIIKSAREARQMSVNEVAQRLLLGKQTVAALEADDYSRISAKVYAEGYLKAYAQLLQIPADTLIMSFRNLNLYSDNEAKAEIKTQSQDNKILTGISKIQNANLMLLGGLGLLIFGILILFIVKFSANKNTEITRIPGVSSGVVNEVSGTVEKEDQSPVVTTDAIDGTVETGLEKNRKNAASPVTVEPSTSDSLMLDIPPEQVAPKKTIKRK